MAGPITWQNVTGASLADASRPMEVAQRSFNGAFDGLQGILKEREAIDASNQVAQRNNNTQSYLDGVAQLGQTPEQLQEAIKSGALERLRSSFGPNIDHAATRGAAEALLDTRYKQVQAANTFGDAQIDRSQLADRDRIQSDFASGDPLRIAAAKDWLNKNDLRNEAALMQAGTTASRDLTEFGWKGDKAASDKQAAIKQLLVADANIAQSKAQAEYQTGSLNIQREAAKETRDEHLSNRIDKARLAVASSNADLASSAGGTSHLTDVINKMKDPERQKMAARTVTRLMEIPGMTTAIAESTIMGMDVGSYFRTDGGDVQAAYDKAYELMGSSQEAKKAADRTERTASLEASLKALLHKQNGDTSVAAESEDGSGYGNTPKPGAIRNKWVPPKGSIGSVAPEEEANVTAAEVPPTKGQDPYAVEAKQRILGNVPKVTLPTVSVSPARVTAIEKASTIEKRAMRDAYDKELKEFNKGQRTEFSQESAAFQEYLHPSDSVFTKKNTSAAAKSILEYLTQPDDTSAAALQARLQRARQ
jgi:hypothetical protein